jgi:hypothetical protein
MELQTDLDNNIIDEMDSQNMYIILQTSSILCIHEKKIQK